MCDNENSIDSDSAETFVRMYAKAQPRILGFVLTLIPSQHDAEEILQETSIILWKKWPLFDTSKDFVSWACGIARYEVFRYLRKKPKTLHLNEVVLSGIADLALEQTSVDSQQVASMDALKECLAELPSNDLSLLTMRYRRSIPVVDIATEIGLARSTVFETLQRIRVRLLRCVERRLNLAEGVRR